MRDGRSSVSSDEHGDPRDGDAQAGDAPHGDAQDGVRERARAAGEDVAACLALAVALGHDLPLPGDGGTAARWRTLAAVSEVNLTAGRILEAHADALAILHEAGAREQPGGSWGVFAAEAPGLSLIAEPAADGFLLQGVKPWCSLAGDLTHALVVARTPAGRQLFAVDLSQPGVHVAEVEAWVSRGLRAVPSGPVHFTDVQAHAVGSPGWYLERPGFAWGGMGVAACWLGGALGLRARVLVCAQERKDQLTDLALGSADVALHGAAASLREAAERVDGGRADAREGEVLALRVRSVVADAVERCLTVAAHALGPAPLAFDEDHARRVADLTVYVRQHHGERDLARLGHFLRESAR